MTLAVRQLESSDWLSSNASIFKIVRMATDVGLREYQLLFSIHETPDRRRIPMIGFILNHRITLDRDHDGTWFNIQLESDGFEGAAGAFLCSEKDSETRLMSDDLETFRDFSAAFMTTADWTVNVRGVSGTLMSFLVPRDETFEACFNTSIANAKQ